MISEAEIEQRRTSDQMKSYVEEVRERVESNPDELKRARRGEGLIFVFNVRVG
jgi:hypothetical protein